MEIPLKLGNHLFALAPVYFDSGRKHLGFAVVLVRDRPEGRDIIGEARAAPANPRREKASPYALVEPDAVGHLRDSRPTSSQRFEISFMKLTLVARKALAAYLIISALTRSVPTKGTATLGLGSSSVGKLCSTMGP